MSALLNIASAVAIAILGMYVIATPADKIKGYPMIIGAVIGFILVMTAAWMATKGIK